MEPRIRNCFNQHILAETAARYGVSVAAMRPLESAESFIFEFERENQPFILRLGHSLRRTIHLIQGEVDWINFLARGGADVSPAVLSQQDKLVEPIADGDGEYFLATAFVKAAGRPPQDDDETPTFIERYGQAIGRMHRLTQDYEPADAAWRRPHWDDPIMQDLDGFLPPSEARAQQKLLAQIEHLRQLPRERESYGLVHQDAHGGNFFVDETGALTFFDFDDCCYTWFVADIAIVLFYAAIGKDDAAAYTSHFLPHFLRGYQRENRFPVAWFAQMPHFLKLRELELYALIHRSHDVNNLTHWWDIRYMTGRKERIEQDVPFIDFDFAGLRWA